MANGFLYDVKAIVDKASFAEGIRELQKLEQTSKRLIAGISGVSASVIGSATIAGEVATQELRVARSIGVSTEALSSWKVAANVAGASASGLIGTLSALENKMQHLKTGTVDSALAKNLGMLGVGYGEFADMDAESRMRTVFNQADQMEDQQLAATLVGDILGQAGRDYYDSLKLSGKSIDEQLQEARKLNFVSNQNRKEAALFASEIRAVKEAGKSITMLFGSEIASALTPTVRTVKTYLINNRDAIRKGITGFAQQTASLFNSISGGLIKIVPIVNGLIDNFGGLDKIIVKVGVGFASFKLMQFAGGIRSIVSSIGLLKAGLGALALGGISLVLDDIFTHFMGGESLIFDHIIPKLEELKKQFEIDDKMSGFVDAWSNLVNKLKDDKFQTALKGITDWLVNLGGNTLTTVIKELGNLLDLLTAIAQGDWKKAAVSGAKVLTDASDYVVASVTGQSVEDVGGRAGAQKRLNEALTQNNIKMSPRLPKNRINEDDLPQDVKKAINDLRDLEATDILKGYSSIINFKKVNDGIMQPANRVNDGIIQPSGKITQVSPEDWVFAVKDIADLAGAFLPSGVTTNNNMNAPASYVINQNFSFGGNVRPSDVKTHAYRGTSEALQSNLSNASRIMQLMPGTR